MEKIDKKYLELLDDMFENNPEKLARGTVQAHTVYVGGKKEWSTYADRKVKAYEFDSFCWDKDVHDFISALRKIGVKKFVYTNTSTSVMDNLHGFAMEGCYIEGLVKREDSSRWHPMRRQGIVVCLRENKQE